MESGDVRKCEVCSSTKSLALLCHGCIRAGEPDEKALDDAYKVGQSSGLEEAAGILMNEAGISFKSGHDGDAKLLRAIAVNLKKLSDGRHPNKAGVR